MNTRRSKPKSATRRRRITDQNPIPVALVSAVPEKPLTLEYSASMRFSNTDASTANTFSTALILNTVLNATSASLLTVTFQFVKLRRIRMWAYSLQTSGGGPNNIASISYTDTTAGEEGNSRTYVLSPCGAAPAYHEHKFRPTEAFGRWQSASGAASFVVTATDVDIVLELDVTFRNAAGLAQPAIVTGTSLVTGAHYFRGLDGLAKANTKWPIHAAGGDTV